MCAVGSSDTPVLDGCLVPSGNIDLEIIHTVHLKYIYDPIMDNQNGGTIAKLSTTAKQKMGKCGPQCPYDNYQKFLDYFGDFDYRHKFVTSALRSENVSFTNGSVDFVHWPAKDSQRAATVGALVFIVWIYVIRELEDTLDDCHKGCVTDQCNGKKVLAWDEGVAFYTGSMEGYGGLSGKGRLLYTLADDLCRDFRTCGPNGKNALGLSKVNFEIFKYFKLGNSLLLQEECEETRNVKENVVNLMKVPLVQATLCAQYKQSATGITTGELTPYAFSVRIFDLTVSE